MHDSSPTISRSEALPIIGIDHHFEIVFLICLRIIGFYQSWRNVSHGTLSINIPEIPHSGKDWCGKPYQFGSGKPISIYKNYGRSFYILRACAVAVRRLNTTAPAASPGSWRIRQLAIITTGASSLTGRSTARNLDFFPNHADFAQCPFQGGLNQLWRNQLLALSIEQDELQPYQHVSFSVVRHPRNTALDTSLEAYQHLIADNPKFSTFTSADVIGAASRCDVPDLNAWIDWNKGLYNL